MQSRKPCALVTYLCGTSLFFIIGGVVLFCLWGILFDLIISGNLVLKPDSATYDLWVKNPVPVTLKLYVYNWTNSHEVYTSGVKPKFRQMGPYSFKETINKVNITWNSNNTVTYKNMKKWYFDPTESNGTLSENVTSLNPVALSAAYAVRNWNFLLKKGMSVSLGTMIDSITLTRPVGQVLFEGYDDPLMNLARKMPVFGNLPPMDKFGWFYGRNGSQDYEGTFNMNTGINGQLGQLRQWRYSDNIPYFPGECGALKHTSAGEFFPRELTKDSIIKFFSQDMCRYVELEFEKEVTISGVLGYKYSAGDRFLDNGTKIPENRCFCDGNCMPSGLLNISACRYGSPAFVSLPHFFKADPYYINNVEGIVGNESDSEFFMVFEPTLGIPLQVAARLQLNLLMQPINGMSLYQNVPHVYFPVLWFQQAVHMPDDMLFQIKILLNFKVICWTISIILISIGIIINICLVCKICNMNLFGRKKEKISKEEVPLNK